MTATLEPGDLAGAWTFQRRLVDRRAETFGRATGAMTIAAHPGRESWHESGELRWSGQRLAFTRTMGFARFDGQWWVTFEDGRPFHPWRLDEAVLHPCAQDLYSGLLTVDESAQRFRVVWDITGPAKQQRIITRYRRQPA